MMRPPSPAMSTSSISSMLDCRSEVLLRLYDGVSGVQIGDMRDEVTAGFGMSDLTDYIFPPAATMFDRTR